jgi:hypothetical protein
MKELANWFQDLPTWAKILVPIAAVVGILLIWQPWKKPDASERSLYDQAQTVYQPIAAAPIGGEQQPMPYALGQGYAVPAGWTYYVPGQGDETNQTIPPSQEPAENAPSPIYVYGTQADIEMARQAGLTGDRVQYIDITGLPTPEQIAAIQRGGVVLGGAGAIGGLSAQEEELARKAGANITRIGGADRYETLRLYRQWYTQNVGA